MSLWFDSKGNSYAGDSRSTWLRKYVDSVLSTVQSRIAAHVGGTAEKHNAEDILFGNSNAADTLSDLQSELSAHQTAITNAATAISGEASQRSQAISTLQSAITGEQQSRTTQYNSLEADLEDIAASVLSKENTTPFEPTGNYQPATKKYVDTAIASRVQKTDYATASSAGVVKVTGNDGLKMESGVLKAEIDASDVSYGEFGNVDEALSDALDLLEDKVAKNDYASATNAGVVKVGTGLDITNGVLHTNPVIQTGEIELTNTASFPFNNSGETISLPSPVPTEDYRVVTEYAGSYMDDNDEEVLMNNVGDIVITHQENNGFRIAYTGSAPKAVIRYAIVGGAI